MMTYEEKEKWLRERGYRRIRRMFTFNLDDMQGVEYMLEVGMSGQKAYVTLDPYALVHMGESELEDFDRRAWERVRELLQEAHRKEEAGFND